MAGLTVSGGEPFQQPLALRDLLRQVRERTSGQFDIVVYSGYLLSTLRLRHADVLAAVDVVIDGRYRQLDLTDKPLRGSGNQRVHRLTALARHRYTDADDPASRVPPQLALTGASDIELYGTPTASELRALELSLADHGLTGDLSWR